MASSEVILKLGSAENILTTLNEVRVLRTRVNELNAQVTTAMLAIAELTRRIEAMETRDVPLAHDDSRCGEDDDDEAH